MTTQCAPADEATVPDNGSGQFIADLDDRTPAGIAAAVSRQIRSGALTPGSRLPTVREVARELKVSPATVNQAWRALAAAGAIVARGRAGTFVGAPVATRPATAVGRYQRLHPPSYSAFRIDLSGGTPDPELLPDLGAALRDLTKDGASDLAADYLGEAVLPELAAKVRADWPFRAERLAVLDGALDAVDRLLSAHVRLGDAVAVEDPCFPPFLDLLAGLGARPIPVRMDESGLLPDELARAVTEQEATALILQPRGQNPTGVSITARRIRELSDILQDTGTLVIEDDHSAGIAAAPLRSLGSRLPRRTVHIRSYSKSHGADLRLAVAGGPADLLDPVIERRMLGAGWTSRLLQRVLLSMLDDENAVHAVTTARAEYRRRSAELRRALARRGVAVARGDGINLWLPVADENAAMISLAAAGIKAAPGGPFVVGEHPPTDHLRITISPVTDPDLDWLATELAAATTAVPTYRRIRRG
ncbi:PLP-dependent aminotransferase family protein [Nocardia iowensis]|uniref:Aminotransferase class I/II-fold pyridoxal phosphate-dependent enzyme n=1 Tax=Nocardia iowensis TaxID=204891 RepID=A0ABX8RI57_NOCIO|nr:aminotransferase class I/II-fold pyridoxal phosphate-dependent enzyme [Nocardia iowensis]QXN89036.1 aminotransferase class I/II-fold pyridoxal phosphate-dependent enzyme [Nocardia iowensis]